MTVQKKYSLIGLAFILPSFLYYIFIFLYPLFLSVINAFSRINLIAGTRTFIGFINFENLFNRVDFIRSIGVTVLYAFMAVPMLIIVALFIANCLSKLNGILAVILTTVVFLPFMVSMVSAGMVWDWLFDPNLGLINNVLRSLGMANPPGWLRSPNTALISTVIITLWIRLPFSIMILLGGIKNVPQELYEAANIDGASEIRQFFTITVPLINPQLVMVLTLETIFAFKAFDQIYVATGGGPAGATKTIMIYMITDVFNQDYGMASALTMLLLIVLFTISCLQQVILKKKIEF